MADFMERIEVLLANSGGRRPKEGEPICPKCDWYLSRLSDDPTPWCDNCEMKYPEEFNAVFDACVRKNRRLFLERASVPPAFRNCGLDNYEIREGNQRRALDALKSWSEDRSQPGLYLHGPVGVGKTHLAVGALLDLIARQRSARYVAVYELLLEARESFRDKGNKLSEILDRCTNTDSLLIDDLCAEKTTDFARETFLTITDRAYGRRRPILIVTSNLDLGDLGRKLDERIADRLRQLCVAVKLGGTSHRRRAAARRDVRPLGSIQISTGSPS